MNRPYVNVDEQLKQEISQRSKLTDLCWYHGRKSREESEQLLALKVDTNGSYLIRESSSCPKTIVLSATFRGVPAHYQILRDIFCVFYLDDSWQPFIGLDVLLDFLKNPTTKGNPVLPEALSSFIPGQIVPFDYLSKSPTTLLHERCAAGDVKTVRAILCSSQFDKRSLNWRDENGRTPLHIASEVGSTEITRMLVNSGAFIENINKSGETALHVACKFGSFSVVTALIQHGASINKFTVMSKSTALHISCSENNLKIFEWLVQSGAALFAVDSERRTPLEVAMLKGHQGIVDFILNYTFPSPKFQLHQFMHPELSRYQAHDILKDHGGEEGLFLVRGSKRCLGPVLSLISKNALLNYEIRKLMFLIGHKQVEMYSIDDSPFFPSIELLVDYFASEKSLSSFRLTTPVPPILREPLTIDVGDPNTNSSPEGSNLMMAQNAVLIAPEELIFGRTLGQGAYGEVVEAIWTRKGSLSPTGHADIACSTSTESVAVKKIVAMKDSNCQLDFLSEVRALFTINHPGIVKLIGISFGPPVMLITELVNGGSLLDFLIDSGDSVTLQQMVAWAGQIARPMAYLESRKLIHRDLAARNILLKSYKMCKICDFGLSRMVGEDKEYYVATKGGKWPLRWYAPESVNRWHFSSASDVWSYGITLHEIFSYGAQPYGELTWEQVFDLIDEGQRLSQPVGCPDAVYQIMMSCWEYQPLDRPTFSELNSIFMSPDFLSAFSITPKAITDPLSPTGTPTKSPHPVDVTCQSNAQGSGGGNSSGYGSFVKYVEAVPAKSGQQSAPPARAVQSCAIDDSRQVRSANECNHENYQSEVNSTTIQPPQKLLNKESLARIKRPNLNNKVI